MTPRAATRSDAPMIAALWNGMIRDTLATFTTTQKTATDIERLIADRPGAVWVAPEGAGFITWGPFRAGPGYRHTVEHSIVTARPGQGVGAVLLRHGLAQARAQGHHVMVAALSSANPRAASFHAAHGFEPCGRLPEVGRKAGQWLDLILMQKILIDD